uniref:Uncharacterized protein n=1 Tax=Macaca fascicularis TaxID=9541 RepID=A0A7N9CWQ7_MACFA
LCWRHLDLGLLSLPNFYPCPNSCIVQKSCSRYYRYYFIVCYI